MKTNTELSKNLIDSLRRDRNAIIGRGGDISPTAGFRDLERAIYNIPADNALTTITYEDVGLGISVPENTTGYAYIAEIGGMTYKCKQLIPYPYSNSDKTSDGVTYTVGKDGGISVSGVAGEFAQFVLAESLAVYPTTYTMRLYGTFSNIQGTVSIYDESGARLIDYQIKSSAVTINLTSYPAAKSARIYLKRTTSGVEVTGTIYPMFNFGNAEAPYELYYAGLRNAKTTEIVSEGANLIPYPFDFKSYTSNGVTFTANEDQTITISGTATAGSSVGVIRTQTVKAKAGETFTVSTSGVWTGNNGYVVVNQRINGETITSVIASTAPKTFTVEQDCDLTVAVVVFKGNTYNGSITIMLNRGASAAPWKPYIGTISARVIPAEIQALEGFGDGISIDYYNKADFVNNKYKRVIDTFVFDGSEGTGSQNKPTGWRISGSGESAYFLIKIGEFGEYAIGDVIICDKYDATLMSGTNIGVWLYNSTSSGGVCLGFRPEGVSEMLSGSDIVSFLANNPITVKVARTVPIESDLPVYMSPLIEVEGGGTLKFVNEYGYAAPLKVVFHAYTQ